MSVQPIDLQVLFSQLNQIGREQMAQKNMIIQAQSVAANEIAQRSEEDDHKVRELKPEEDGPEKTSDESEHAAEERSGSGTGEKDHEASNPEVLRDPDLGQHIDISG